MKTICLFLLLLCPAFLFAKSESGHSITIKIKGFPKDSTAHIGYYYGKSRYVAQDTAKADKNGVLHFTGKKTLPEGVYICLLPKGYFEFLVTSQSFTMETDMADLEQNMKIKGSKENTWFYEFRKYTAHEGMKADSISKIVAKRKNKDSVKMLRAQMQVIDKRVDSFREKFMAKYPESFAVKLLKAVKEPEIPESPTLKNGRKDSTFPYRYFKAHYFDNISFKDEWLVRTPFFESKVESYLKNMLQPIPDSIIKDVDELIERSKANQDMFKYILSYTLNYYEESQYMGMDAISSHLVEKYYFTGQTPWVPANQIYNMRKRDSIVSHLLIGKQAPDMYLTDSNGKVITLYSIHKKYTLLYFWDATCGHCQKETPLLHDFYVKYKNKYNFEIYAPTIERKTTDWKKYMREHNIGDWINVWDSYTVTDFNKVYDVYSTPVLYILDANKKIIAKRIDSGALPGFFENLEKMEGNKPPAPGLFRQPGEE